MRGFVLVALGSSLGGVARHALTLAADRAIGDRFPWGTLLVNLLGSSVLGAIVVLTPGESRAATEARLLLGVGVMGGFTTYSSFNQQTLTLWASGARAAAAACVAATLLGGLAAGLVGAALARALRG